METESPDQARERVKREALEQINKISLTDEEITAACFEWKKRKFFKDKSKEHWNEKE